MTAVADRDPRTATEILDEITRLDEIARLDEPPSPRNAAPMIGFAGNPDEVEIAAVLVALATVCAARGAAPPAPPEDRWGAPEQLLRYGLSSMPMSFPNARYIR